MLETAVELLLAGSWWHCKQPVYSVGSCASRMAARIDSAEVVLLFS